MRKKIDGYNKGNEYSVKKVSNERNSYFEEYLQNPYESYNSKTNQRLTRMNIIYRLSHSTERKFVDFYASLKARVLSLGFSINKGSLGKSTKADEEHVRKFVIEVYDLYHVLNTQSDSVEIDFKHNLTNAFPNETLDLASNKIFEVFRLIESIDSQKENILKTPIEVEGETFTEHGSSESYINLFPDLIHPLKFDEYDEDPSSDEEVEAPKPKKKEQEKVVIDQKDQEKDLEFMSRVEDVKNHFKEFFEKHKKLIFAKEFWQLFLNDILSELKTDKTDEQLFFLFDSPDYLNDVEAAHYLIEHRDSIKRYSKFLNSEIEQGTEQRKKRPEDSTSRPTNFGVKVENKPVISSEYAAYDESRAAQTNYEILGLLVCLVKSLS